MQRALILATALVIVLALLVNGLQFVQNRDLRQRLAARPPAAAAAPSADQTAKLDKLTADLNRYKLDFDKAFSEARRLREKAATLDTITNERDALKIEVDALRGENSQLKNDVQNLQAMNTINGSVSALRGQAALSSVPRSFMNRDQLRQYFTESYAREYSAEEEAADQVVLRALDMADEQANGDLRAQQIESLADSVLGFYDHDTKQLVVVTRRPKIGVQDRITYAHEFAHSLQDQHYGLTQLFARADGNADYSRAIQALVEGDATMTMWLYAQQDLTEMDMAKYQLEIVADLDANALFGGGYSGPMVESAAAFPYQEGAEFAGGLYSLDGYDAISRAFANPPRSTEQVIHPEKYFDGDEPVVVLLPNLVAALPGWKLVHENTLGELYTRIYLEHALDFDTAIPAGTGWGGDRYQVLQNEQGQTALALRTAWDTSADADEFFDAYNRFILSVGGANTALIEGGETSLRYQLDGRQISLSRSGNQVLVLHAPDAATLDVLTAQF
ncbi:MAG: hypothetical protein H7Z42_15270 [Roseiflexaceae bacterium]|nr:hypothetical protein [Roseiflexaceae bacterium]